MGSKTVAGDLSEPLSTATIRNIMVHLERAGFLEQPHVSAGRVPTDRAYRFYVDRMAGQARLSRTTERYIDESLDVKEMSSDQLMTRISHILSEVSQNVGLVLGPAIEEKLLAHVKFVALPDRRVLAVIVSKPDLIENKVIRLDEEPSQAELDSAANYLNREFRGWSLRTIRLEIFKRIEEMNVVSDRIVAQIATLFSEGALGGEEAGPLFVDGTATILDQPEFVDARNIKELLAIFEDKAKLVRILSACLASSSRGPQIVIGRENPESEMQRCTFVVAPYRYRNRAVGALGVVGPTRMEYDRAITTVEYIAHLTSRLLSIN